MTEAGAILHGATGRYSYLGIATESGGGVTTETWVNDIFRNRIDFGDIGAESVAIQHDLQPGRNIVELRVTVPGIDIDSPTTPMSGEQPKNAFASISLQRDDVRETGSSFEATTTTLHTENWNPSEADPSAGRAAIEFPQRLQLAFEAPENVIAPPWARATTLMSDSAANDVLAEIARLGQLVRDEQIEAYTNALALRYRHTSAVYPLGFSADALREEDFSSLTELVSTPGFVVNFERTSDARFRLCANGRLASWVRADGQGLIRVNVPGEDPMALDLMFSLIDGRWVVSR